MATLFISDLHLCKQRPEIIDLFIRFLQQHAGDAEALYILGDLFEYWIGDEAIDYPEHQMVIKAMHELVNSGTKLYLMHGNRDFLLGKKFEAASGGKILNDPTVVDLYGTPVILLHGDSLGIDDKEYIQIRNTVRSPQWQQDFLAKSVEERERMSKQFREDSITATSEKTLEIMDANQGAIEQEMRNHNVTHMIHGHTHRPDIHNFLLDGQAAERIVLGDWYDQGSVLRCIRSKWSLDVLPLDGT